MLTATGPYLKQTNSYGIDPKCRLGLYIMLFNKIQNSWRWMSLQIQWWMSGWINYIMYTRLLIAYMMKFNGDKTFYQNRATIWIMIRCSPIIVKCSISFGWSMSLANLFFWPLRFSSDGFVVPPLRDFFKIKNHITFWLCTDFHH